MGFLRSLEMSRTLRCGTFGMSVILPLETMADSIEEKIKKARGDARILYTELGRCQRRVRDGDLMSVCKQVPKLQPSDVNLRVYNTLLTHRDKIALIQWSDDSKSLVSACQDGYMFVWDAVTGYKTQAIALENNWVLTCAYAPSGRFVASAGLDNACTIYAVGNDTMEPDSELGHAMYGITLRVQSVFKGHTAYISGCQFLTDLNIVTSSGDMTCATWDIERGKRTCEYVDHLGDVLCVAAFRSSFELQFVTGLCDGTVRVWDPRVAGAAQTFAVGSDVTCVEVFPDGNAVVSGSDDGIVRLFDRRADSEIASYSLQLQLQLLAPVAARYRRRPASVGSDNHSSNDTLDSPGVTSVAFSRSGRVLYSCYAEYGGVVWDTLGGQAIGVMTGGHSDRITGVAASRDGVALATSSWDHTVKIWSA